jgi:hypothetical protein
MEGRLEDFDNQLSSKDGIYRYDIDDSNVIQNPTQMIGVTDNAVVTK